MSHNTPDQPLTPNTVGQAIPTRLLPGYEVTFDWGKLHVLNKAGARLGLIPLTSTEMSTYNAANPHTRPRKGGSPWFNILLVDQAAAGDVMKSVDPETTPTIWQHVSFLNRVRRTGIDTVLSFAINEGDPEETHRRFFEDIYGEPLSELKLKRLRGEDGFHKLFAHVMRETTAVAVTSGLDEYERLGYSGSETAPTQNQGRLIARAIHDTFFAPPELRNQ